MKRRTTVSLLLVVLLIAACASTAGPVSTPQQAQKALAEAQAARVAVRDAIAKSYVTAQQGIQASPNDQVAVRIWTQAQAARVAFNKVDPAFTTAWGLAADAVDAWLKAPADQSAADTFHAVFTSVTKSLNDLRAAQAGGGQ